MSEQPLESYQKNYQALQQISQKLAQADDIDIDQLVPMVDEATKAYQVCQSRIEAVERALNQRLSHESDDHNTNAQ